MLHHRSFFQSIVLLCCLLVVIACKSQDKSGQESENIAQHADPEVDSVLRFSSLIRCIYEDSAGDYWFGSHSQGLCRFDGEQFFYYSEDQGLPDVQVRRIIEDTPGKFLIELQVGVARFDGKHFELLKLEEGSELLQADPNITDQGWQKQLDEYWFGANNRQGFLRYDGEKLRHYALPVPDDHPDFDENGRHPKYGYDTYAVYGYLIDSKNRIWIGTAGAGLYLYDGKSYQCINCDQKIGVIRSIYEDKAGNIWFGNNGDNLYKYDGESLINFTEENGLTEANGAFGISEDPEGNLWFGTYRNGLWKFDPNVEKNEDVVPGPDPFTNFQSAAGVDLLRVACIYRDSKGHLWIGAGEEGEILRYDGQEFMKFEYAGSFQ